MTALFKRLFIVLGLTIAIVGGYLLISQSGSMNNTDSLDIASQKNTSEEIFEYSQQISVISFDKNILSDDRFLSLDDFSVDVKDIPTGRSNPFVSTQ